MLSIELCTVSALGETSFSKRRGISFLSVPLLGAPFLSPSWQPWLFCLCHLNHSRSVVRFSPCDQREYRRPNYENDSCRQHHPWRHAPPVALWQEGGACKMDWSDWEKARERQRWRLSGKNSAKRDNICNLHCKALAVEFIRLIELVTWLCSGQWWVTAGISNVFLTFKTQCSLTVRCCSYT